MGSSPAAIVLATLHRPALVDSPELLGRAMAALEVVARDLPVLFPAAPAHPRNRSCQT